MDAEDEEAMMQFEKGYLWEVALSRAFGEKAAIRIGEVERDGIIGSPDGINYDDDGEMFVEEYKATTFSSNRTPDSIWTWMMQVKGYCAMLGTVKAVMRVLYLCGNYHPLVPQYVAVEYTFTQTEIDENWACIVNQAAVMKRRAGNE